MKQFDEYEEIQRCGLCQGYFPAEELQGIPPGVSVCESCLEDMATQGLS